MTCIAAIADGETVWMGGDRAETRGDMLGIHGSPKVFKKGGMLIGSSGDPRIGQIMEHGFVVPPIGDDDVRKYVAIKFVNELRRCASVYGFLGIDNGCEKMDGRILLGIQGTLFVIAEWFSAVQTAHGYEAIGGGESIAKGVLFATKHEYLGAPRDRLMMAMEAAEFHCASVRGPFDILRISNND